MAVAAIVNKTKYGARSYFSAALLCFGTAGFAFAERPGANSTGRSSNTGIMLLCASIFCDALAPNLQQRLMAVDGSGLSSPQLMVNVNSVGW